jgi:hypothetical protein
MTNDVLQASVAAALVQANLSFTTGVAPLAGQVVRVFQLDFGDGASRTTATGYVTGRILVVFAPIRIPEPVKRREIAEELTQHIPTARIFPSPGAQFDQAVAWIEAAVPVSADEPAPPWLAVHPFLTVGAAADYVLRTFPDDASPAGPQTAVPMLATGTLPVELSQTNEHVIGPGASESIQIGPFTAAKRVALLASDERSEQLLVSSFKIGNVDTIIGGLTPATVFREGQLVDAGKPVTVRVENRGNVEQRIRLVAK